MRSFGTRGAPARPRVKGAMTTRFLSCRSPKVTGDSSFGHLLPVGAAAAAGADWLQPMAPCFKEGLREVLRDDVCKAGGALEPKA
mmetsp:Transcript_85768/g.220778  ORF Transcript_85768/g.220778 Transcript_85768/m.220778 type:complete len:85 (-) Transcript_85768:2-256(-)